MLAERNTARDRLVEDNLGLVHACANRFRGKGVEYDDLFQAGCVGLIKAADNFDKSRGFAFSTYAVPAVLGEIKRIFRDGGSVKIGRTQKENAIKLLRLKDSMTAEMSEEPSVSELAEKAGLSVFETAELLGAVIPPLSLTVLDGEDNETQMDLIGADGREDFVDRLTLTSLIEALPPEEAALIRLRYFSGMTQAQTAKALKMSQVQVSRKEKSALKKMRELL